MKTDIKNTIVLGEPGSGKTSCIAINETIDALKQGHSLFVNDNSKEEIYKSTYDLAKSQGYNIILLDYLNYKGDSFNCLGLVKDYYQENESVLFGELISLISEALNKPVKGSEDPFWTISSTTYIKGIIYYLLETKSKKISLEALSHLCVESFARIEFLGLGRSTPMASSLLNGVFTNSEKTTASILMTAFATISSILTNSKIKRITRTTSFDIRKIPKEKTIIYLKYPEYSEQYDGLVSLFLTELIHVLYHSCDQTGQLDIPFHFIIDEFAHFRLPSFERYISTARSRNIQFTLLIQSMDQLEIGYSKPVAKTIMDCCQNIISFQTTNYNTLTYMSQLSGYRDTVGHLPRVSMNDLLKLRPFEAFCLINHQPSIQLFKPYFMRRDYL